MAKYQFFAPLPDADYQALKADIAENGVQVAIDVDEDGNILDGHHRKRACDELGIPCPTRVMPGFTEAQKVHHARSLNTLRRHIDRRDLGSMIAALAEARGVSLKHGGKREQEVNVTSCSTIADIAAEVGVSESTAKRALKDVADFNALPPDRQAAIVAGETTLRKEKPMKRKKAKQAPPVAPVEHNPATLAGFPDATSDMVSEVQADTMSACPVDMGIVAEHLAARLILSPSPDQLATLEAMAEGELAEWALSALLYELPAAREEIDQLTTELGKARDALEARQALQKAPKDPPEGKPLKPGPKPITGRAGPAISGEWSLEATACTCRACIAAGGKSPFCKAKTA